MWPEPWPRIVIARGDITLEHVDAIVNAANPTLRGGGGVDGAIHRAAGPALLAECVERYPDGCATGEAKITSGHALPARYVIHTVGPIWRGGGAGEAQALRACYENSLALAAAHGLQSLAFPAISAGAYGYPWHQAALVALDSIASALLHHRCIELVRLVLLGAELAAVFEQRYALARELARSAQPETGA